ncbi:MAG: methyltransferase [Hyphomonas sp. BRH_c22]|uniref:class I SAM-dependent methyltransferase n=1 Tax=Hyphomonas sp. BRH_c22 TaxID=1629710 RepID=UPI0005F21F97|nr:class I SAM-dependent methyltransferase [Hyphomonas sp. BRH_c22]KJS35732.1 MAG: methyltransferase [Hyphomonas sp. BRH_c22]
MPFKNTSGDAESYADRVARHVPGLKDMHRMAGLLLAERVPERGRVLVLGAGGGLELKAFAETYPNWRFDGVDPSSEMIEQAKLTLEEKARRVTFHQGYIDDAPEGPFDGAACLLTLHFLPKEERIQTVREVLNRLRPGAPFVVAHHSFPQSGPRQALWLRRNANLLISAGFPSEHAEKNIEAMREKLPALSPSEDEEILSEAGYENIQLFYAAFTFKGWVAYRPDS